MQTITTFRNRIRVFKLVERNTANDYGFNFAHHTHPLRVDCSESLADFDGNEFIQALREIDSKQQLINWLNENLGGLEDAQYLLMTRSVYRFQKQTINPLKPKPGRKRKHRLHHMWLGWDSLLKFEMESGQCVKIWDRKSQRKRPPYNKPRYPVIKAIEDNNKILYLPYSTQI